MALRALLIGSAVALTQATTTAHPIEKVITLLQNLAVKSEAEGKAEEVAYTTFEHWCANSKKSLQGSVDKGKETVEELVDTIAAHKSNIEVVGKEVSSLTVELSDLDVTGGAGDKERADGAALYAQEKKSLEDTIKAISDAVALLTTTKSKNDAMLLQKAQQGVALVAALVAATATPQQRSLLQAFAGKGPDLSEGAAPDAAARPDLKAAGDGAGHVKKYASKLDSVIEMLKELSLKFQDQLVETNKAETNALNAHALIMSAHNAVVKTKQEAKAGKVLELSGAEGDLSLAQASLTQTQGDLDADSATLSATESNCHMKAEEWAERSSIRSKEKEAIAAAVEILAKVAGVRTTAPSNPVLPPLPVAFLQLAAVNPKAEKAVQLLRSEAKVTHSKVLEKLAATLAAHEEGPFDQVVNMIQKMIFHLMDEQKQEDEHKNWCDLEGNKTQASITDKEGKLAELSAVITEVRARAAALATEVADATSMVATITSHIEQATQIREVGKQENKEAIADAAEAQQALANAVSVLKDFYKSSGAMPKESYEFLQAPVTLPDEPSSWAAGYNGVADPAAQPGGIVTVLETVSADFATMESQTKAQEAQDQQAFDADVQESAIERARRTKEAEMKTQEKERLVEKQAGLVMQHKTVAGELDATTQYMKDLAPACFDGTSTYEERHAARDQEIAALKQAQTLLQEAFKEPAVAAEPTLAPAFLAKRKGGAAQGVLSSH